jgi:FdhD protein
MNELIQKSRILIYKDGACLEQEDLLAVEAPLEVEIRYWDAERPIKKDLVLLMRSPGNDEYLVRGFMLSEGIIARAQDIERIQLVDNRHRSEEKADKAVVFISKLIQIDSERLNRNFISSSSCGFCGKDSMESLNESCFILPNSGFELSVDKILKLREVLDEAQRSFDATGGVHGVGIINSTGALEYIQEDVGRHNALDKVIGMIAKDLQPPYFSHGLIFSGRTSYEMVHKALMLGFPFVVSIGAPTSLAVDFADENDMTLICFLKEKRMNIYSGDQRIVF